MERPVLSAMLAIGILVGCVVGAAYARARRGWADYQYTKARARGLRKLAWLLSRVAATKIGIVVLLLVGAVAYAAVGSDEETAGPVPTPSATPSRQVGR